MKKLLPLLLFILYVTASYAQKQDLALNLKKGRAYKQTTNAKAQIHQTLNGQNMDMVMTIKGSMTYLVKDISGKEYELEARFENMALKMELPNGTVEFSSEKNDEKDVVSQLLAYMKQQSFEITMSRSGKIKEVRNLDVLWDNIFKEFPQLSPEQAAQLKAQLMKSYGPEAMKGSIEAVTAVFPEKAVAKGDTWQVQTKLESGMAATMQTTYKLTEVNSDHYMLTGNSTIATADKDAYIETNGMPLKYDLAGTMVSEIKVDKKTGWVLEATLNQEIKGTAHIKENPQLPEGMEIPMVIKNETVVTNK